MKQLTLKSIKEAESKFNSKSLDKAYKLFNNFQKKHIAYGNLLGFMSMSKTNPLAEGEFMLDFFNIFWVYENHYKLTIRKFTPVEFSETIGKWYAFFEDKKTKNIPKEKLEEAAKLVKQKVVSELINLNIAKPLLGSKLKDKYSIITIYALFYCTIELLNEQVKTAENKKKA